jgi:hypothetical protein
MQHFASRGPWCLLAGVITTIAVAWGCALWSPLEFTTLQFLHSATGVQGQSFSWTWNERPGHGVNWVWIQPGVFRLDPPDPPAAPPRWVQLPDEKISLIRYLASGWPLRCMNARLIERSTVNVRGTRVVGARQTVFAWDYAYIIEPAKAIDPFTAKILPLNPHVPELIANSIFWGLVWYAVILVVARVRSLFRTRKGVCPKCRYDLRNLTGSQCPECGSAIATTIPQSPNQPEEAPQS